ncbi:MAG TPA: class I SAM-dependent methyltransferase [Polyangia bacterium]
MSILPIINDVGLRPLKQRRASLCHRARGRVLDLGIGTGLNLLAYPTVDSVIGVDTSEQMLAVARARALACRYPVVLARHAAEAMPFEDGEFDTVVSTFALCSVQDPAAVAREIRRVLSPDGLFLFLEHVRSPDPQLRRWQERFRWPWGKLLGGCDPSRDVVGAIRQAGLRIVELEEFDGRWLPLVRPHVMGAATR